MNEDKETQTSISGAVSMRVVHGEVSFATARGAPTSESFPKVETHPITLDIPDYFCAAIGRIITIWAHVEWVLAGILCDVIDVGRKEGRILITGRTNELYNRLKQLLDVRDISVATDLPTYATNLTEGERIRNLLAHGVWGSHTETGRLFVQNPSGQWKEGNKPIGSKRVDPEAVYPDTKWFATRINDAQLWLADTRILEKEIRDALVALRSKPDKPDPQDQSDPTQSQQES